MSISSEHDTGAGTRQVIDFAGFKRDFFPNERQGLPEVLLVYPVLNLGAPADRVAPHSLYYLYSTLAALEVPVKLFFWDVGEAADNAPLPAADIYYIHPMFATITAVCGALGRLSRRWPNSLICLGNSDQHQHEMCIGGRRAFEVSRYLLERWPEIDLIFTGRNHEYSLARLAANMVQRAPVTEGLGMHLARVGKTIVENRCDRFFEVGDLPFLQLPEPLPPMIRMRSSVGCRAVCKYCVEGGANNLTPQYANWQGMGAERFAREISAVAKTTGRRFLNIIDSSFEDAECNGVERLRHLVQLLLTEDLGLSLKIHLRAETIVNMSDRDLDQLKAVGVDVVIIGAESASDEELEIFGKLASAEKSRQAYERIARDGRFFIVLGYMMFTPFTTMSMFPEKLAYLKRIGRCWDFLTLSNWLLVFWGSRMHDILRQEKLVEDDKNPLGYVKYGFRDARVAQLARALDSIKRLEPQVMTMHKLLFDCGNILARSSNPNNRHLAAVKRDFDLFAEQAGKATEAVSAAYGGMFEDLLKLETISPEAAKGVAAEHLTSIPAMREELEGALHQLAKKIEGAGLSAERLLVETWFSNVNFFGVNEKVA